MILMASWEISLGASVISIFNGGTAGTIYVLIIAWIGFLAVYSSMAEMASMAPTSGGQYHWVRAIKFLRHRYFSDKVISGIRIRTSQISEDPQLRSGLAQRCCLANRRHRNRVPSRCADTGSPGPQLQLLCLRAVARHIAHHRSPHIWRHFQHLLFEATA